MEESPMKIDRTKKHTEVLTLSRENLDVWKSVVFRDGKAQDLPQFPHTNTAVPSTKHSDELRQSVQSSYSDQISEFTDVPSITNFPQITTLI